MTRLENLFRQRSHQVLNVYCTAGFPQLTSTVPVMEALQKHGADIIELGMPYSDPLADGPVIQQSSQQALANGMTLSVLFQQLAPMRHSVQLPVVLMGYLNPLLQYGFERFCRDAAAVGVDGLIIPDIPIEAFEEEYGPIVRRHGLDFVFLVTPETSEERIRKIDQLSSGFIYAVSSSSVTGSNKDFSIVAGYLQRLQTMNLKNPVLVGFGIKDKESFEAACSYSNGAIIGSAYIQALEKDSSVEAATSKFLQQILTP